MSTAQVDQRIAERRAEVRSQRRRVRLRRTLTVLVVGLVALTAVLVERSSLVALASIRVEGDERLAEAQVRELAGLELGTSVLRLPLGRAEQGLRDHPLVAQARVERDGVLGVVVRLREAEPALVARGPGGASALIGPGGTVLARGRAQGVLEVTAGGPLPDPGQDVAELPALATAHEVVVGLPGPVRALLVGASAAGPDDLVLTLRGGLEVRWGDEDRAAEKARALGAVLEDLDGREVSAIDVRAPAAPTVLP